MRVRVFLNIILKNRTCTSALPTRYYKNHCTLNILYIFPYICTYIMYPQSVQFRTFKFPRNPKYNNTKIRSTPIMQRVHSILHRNYYHNTSLHIHWYWLSYKQPFYGKRKSFLKMALTASFISFTLRTSARVLYLQLCP